MTRADLTEDPIPHHRAGADRTVIGAWLLSIVIGGGNAVGIAFVVDELDPMWGAAIRFIGSGVVFAVLVLIFRSPIGSRGSVVGAVVYGVVGFAAAFAFAFLAIRDTPPGTAQLIISIVPLLTFGFAIAHGLERFRWRGLFGALVAVIGVAVVFADRVSADVPIGSLLLVLAGSLCIAESAVIVKLTPRSHPLVTNAIGMLVGGLLLLALSAIFAEAWVVPTRASTVTALAFLIVAGSVGVFGLYVFVLQRWTASAASYGFLLIPLFTIAYSAVLTGERITLPFVIGGAVILAGVWVGAFAPTPSVEPSS